MNHSILPYFAQNPSLVSISTVLHSSYCRSKGSNFSFGSFASGLRPSFYKVREQSTFTFSDADSRNEEFEKYFDLRKRFIQRLMKDGKKSVATKLFDEGLEIFYRTIQQSNIDDLVKRSKSRKKSSVD